MISLSDNEFSVINFLVRNFTEKLTMRSIAQRLKFSSPGVFNILKKLEKQGIVIGQKLGTGLFYYINLENRVAKHLAAIVLFYSDEKIELKIEQFEQLKKAESAIFDKKTLLIVADKIDIDMGFDIKIPNVNVVTKTKEDLIDILRKKDTEMLQLVKKGVVLIGEVKFVDIIEKCISRF